MALLPVEAGHGAGPAVGRLQKEPRKKELRRLALHLDDRWQENSFKAPLHPPGDTPLTSQLPRHYVYHHRGDPGIPVILQENATVRPTRGLAVPDLSAFW